MLRHMLNLLFWILPPSRFFGLRRCLLRIAGADIRKEATICGQGWLYGRGLLQVGLSSWIGPGCVFYTHQDAAICIGENCDIAPQVMFVTGSHEIGPSERRAGYGIANPISIGDGVWIGARATITGGVSIGAGSIVAAGAVVTSDVAPNTLVGGVPARLIRVLEP
jgi:maltose O-acetyltransferase